MKRFLLFAVAVAVVVGAWVYQRGAQQLIPAGLIHAPARTFATTPFVAELSDQTLLAAWADLSPNSSKELREALERFKQRFTSLALWKKTAERTEVKQATEQAAQRLVAATGMQPSQLQAQIEDLLLTPGELDIVIRRLPQSADQGAVTSIPVGVLLRRTAPQGFRSNALPQLLRTGLSGPLKEAVHETSPGVFSISVPGHPEFKLELSLQDTEYKAAFGLTAVEQYTDKAHRMVETPMFKEIASWYPADSRGASFADYKGLGETIESALLALNQDNSSVPRYVAEILKTFDQYESASGGILNCPVGQSCQYSPIRGCLKVRDNSPLAGLQRDWISSLSDDSILLPLNLVNERTIVLFSVTAAQLTAQAKTALLQSSVADSGADQIVQKVWPVLTSMDAQELIAVLNAPAVGPFPEAGLLIRTSHGQAGRFVETLPQHITDLANAVGATVPFKATAVTTTTDNRKTVSFTSTGAPLPIIVEELNPDYVLVTPFAGYVETVRSQLGLTQPWLASIPEWKEFQSRHVAINNQYLYLNTGSAARYARAFATLAKTELEQQGVTMEDLDELVKAVSFSLFYGSSVRELKPRAFCVDQYTVTFP